jgi:flavorubredoxin
MKISDDIIYIGVNDHNIDLFEGQYDVRKNGMSYNSYVILDDKVAVTDTVDQHFRDEWLGNLDAALAGRTPDYLIVHHMEPDHSANIMAFMERYPQAVVVASAAAFKMMQAYFGTDFVDRKLVVKQGSELNLGKRTLTFIAAPQVHWPEVVFSYDDVDKVLFSADAFGKFGALDYDDPDGWACEARRYYFGIVGKFGRNVQAVMKKLGGFDIQAVCPLHGPVLTENLDYYLDLYNTWSSYGVESEGVCVAYTSVYGHTKAAVQALVEALRGRGCTVAVHDLARDDMAEAVEDAFRYGKLVLATTTYCGGIFPYMETFLNTLAEHNYQNRTVGLVENGSWAPMAAKNMRARLDAMKDIAVSDAVVSIKGSMDDANRQQIEALADELAQ